ncbi:uncharacterized protein BXZ73DRAFT_106241 [Epithele typhae]|uniref:uncharacterized protein n=1 Tax=Epithele typhae TaxID=378194 RepID=UPI00200806F3|nr:uncharacterized protein BXZ73DRAFT_106241 [Epithele typhae]KAH9915269.1 hypothetical protein BXZ73DRAFT_106241 [Epithele typhae]
MRREERRGWRQASLVPRFRARAVISAEDVIHSPDIPAGAATGQADEDFTISVLSERLLLLAYHAGLAVYAIPPLERADPEGTEAAREPSVHAVRPLWSRECDVGAGIYRISPATWGTRPLVVAGPHALHILTVRGGHGGDAAPEPAIAHREVPYPFSLAAEVGCMGLGAVGLRRAIWDCTEARNGSMYVRFQTYSLPLSVLGVLDGGDGDDDIDGLELGHAGRLGSFSVELDPAEHLVNLCLEESSGRVCLLLNNIITGARRISIVDAV